MPGTPNKLAAAYLDDLYQNFMRSYREDRKAWGQFLDSPAEHPQIGRYGTSAGAIVLDLSGHGGDATARDVGSTLDKWITAVSDKNSCHLAQTLTVAVLLMALWRSPLPQRNLAQSLIQKLREQRLQSDGLWGNYWMNGRLHAEESSVFVSSIVLLALAATNDDQNLKALIAECRQKLERLYFRDPQRHEPYAPVVFAALSLPSSISITKRLAHEMRRYSWKPIELGDRFTYFYDFRGAEDVWGREYFIVPTELFCAMTINSDSVPSPYRLRALDVIDALKLNMYANSGLFKPKYTDKVSTLEQAFAALALNAYRTNEETGTVAHPISNIWFMLNKPRPSLESWGQAFLGILYLECAAIFSWPTFVGDSLTPVQNWVLGAAILGAAYLGSWNDVVKYFLGRKR